MQIIIAFATPTTTPNPPSTGTSHATAIDFSGISPRADRDKKNTQIPISGRPSCYCCGRTISTGRSRARIFPPQRNVDSRRGWEKKIMENDKS